MLSRLLNETIDNQEEDLKPLLKSLCQMVIFNIDHDDPAKLDEFFGQDAYKSYLSEDAREKLFQEYKEKKDIEIEKDFFNKELIATFLNFALYYACKVGAVNSVQYLIEKQKLKGDLEVSVSEPQTYSGIKEELKGPPLSLAAASGNLDLVKYLYEKTDAMVEVTAGQPLNKTPLMLAVKSKNYEIATYLLENGANPNAKVYADNITPLDIAIENRDDRMAALLINAGAIVTNTKVHQAIQNSLSNVNYLIDSNVEKENPFNPYLISAIKSGNIKLYKQLESNPDIRKLEDLRLFFDKSMEEVMVNAAAVSGYVGMMQYLKEEKGIKVEEIIQQQIANEADYLKLEANQPGFDHSIPRIRKIEDVAIYKAAAACRRDTEGKDVMLLYYLMDTLKINVPAEVIREVCAMSLYSINAVAYLYSFLPEFKEDFDYYHSIAFYLDVFSLENLFKIYNSKFIQQGNTLEMHHANNFTDVIEKLIKEKEKTLSNHDILELVKMDKDAAVGALLFYCTRDFDDKTDRLSYLLNKLPSFQNSLSNVDVTDCLGRTLAKYATHEWSFNILRLLLMRGANPDAPDNEGETLINRIIDHPSFREKFKWIKHYADDVTNSLRYGSKRHFGGHEEIHDLLEYTGGYTARVPLKELYENCSQGWNKDWKMGALEEGLAPEEKFKLVLLKIKMDVDASNKPEPTVTYNKSTLFAKSGTNKPSDKMDVDNDNAFDSFDIGSP